MANSSYRFCGIGHILGESEYICTLKYQQMDSRISHMSISNKKEESYTSKLPLLDVLVVYTINVKVFMVVFSY